MNWDESRDMLAKALVRVEEERNLKPGELPTCELSFAHVADKFLAYQKARLKGRNSYDREAGIVGHLKAFFTGNLADVTPVQVSDYVTARQSLPGRESPEIPR